MTTRRAANPLKTEEAEGVFRFHLELRAADAVAADVAELAARLDSFLRRHSLSDKETVVLQTAAEELVTNVGRHGAAADPAAGLFCRGEIRVDSASLSFLVEDNASPFDPLKQPPPDLSAPPEERSPGGLGLFILFRYFDDVRYERVDGVNRSCWLRRRGGGRRES